MNFDCTEKTRKVLSLAAVGGDHVFEALGIVVCWRSEPFVLMLEIVVTQWSRD